MSERDHKYNIQIADDEWIEYVNIDGRYADAIDLDGDLTGLWPLIDRLETHCVAGCCGFDHAQLQAACDQAVRSMVAAASPAILQHLKKWFDLAKAERFKVVAFKENPVCRPLPSYPTPNWPPPAPSSTRPRR